MAIALQADASLPRGYININGQTVATISTADGLSVPMANNTVSGGALIDGAVTQSKIAANTVGMGPAFSAVADGGTFAVTSGQFTKVGNLNTKRFDTNNCFADNRFTPNVPGYYLINGSVIYGTGVMLALLAVLVKNATAYGASISGPAGLEIYYGNYANAGTYSSNVSTLMFFNGTTDYVELAAYHVQGAGQTVGGASGVGTYMNGFLVRGV